MREIKFRVWDFPLKRMGEVWSIEGSRVYARNGKDGFSTINDGTNGVLMQYTGLKDMDGTLVYEGDLIDFGGLRTLKIVWKDAGFQAPLMPYENSNPILLSQDGFSHFAKVIGNIYE